jgi:hypothetical protein
MCFLNRIKRVNSLTPKALEYINKYQQILKTVIKEAKKREFEKCVSLAKNKTKTLWQIISKEMGNSRQKAENIELRYDTEIITNPQQISEKFNSFFIESVPSLRMSNNLTRPLKPPSQNTNYFHASMFISPVTECEVENIIKSLKNSYSAGFDEIPEVIVKTSVHYIKKPLTHIFNLSLQKGLFPDSLKVAKIRPV